MNRKSISIIVMLIGLFVFSFFLHSSRIDGEKALTNENSEKIIEKEAKKIVSAENKVLGPGGIAISFDDHSVREWFAGRDLFRKYEAKVTFFVSNIDLLSKEEVKMLGILKNDGHEIGCHGLNHLNAVNFLKEHSVDEYIRVEIEPSIKK